MTGDLRNSRHASQPLRLQPRLQTEGHRRNEAGSQSSAPLREGCQQAVVLGDLRGLEGVHQAQQLLPACIAHGAVSQRAAGLMPLLIKRCCPHL